MIAKRRPGRRLRDAAGRPVSAASVAFFRIAFGVAMVVNALFYLPDLVHDYYVAPSVHFGYGPLDFVEPLPGGGMYLVYVAQIVAGALIALGLWYRWAAAAFFALTTYVFLIDSTFYQNHEYLISLLSFLLIFLPLDAMWSLDARRQPRRASPTVPAWVLWLLRFQIGVPYFFGGIAKLNSDWLAAEPLRGWLAEVTDIELIGPLFEREAVVYSMAYGALVFDLAIVALLLNRRTRVPAFAVAVGFHLLNARMFGLFIFPWLMIAATTIFFPPEWPLRLLARMRGKPAPPASSPRRAIASTTRVSAALLACLAIWMAVQVSLPLRHFTLAGSPSWTEEGHRFSWHMRLRDKRGSAAFTVTKDARSWRVDPRRHLSAKQAARLAGHPERLVKFARHLAALHGGAEVRAETAVSLNGRPRVPIVDPSADLTSVPLPWLGNSSWIVPLREPLPKRG